MCEQVDEKRTECSLFRAVFTWLSKNQNQSKYTSQPKGVVKPKPKPKPIPFDSQVKTALSKAPASRINTVYTM